MVRRRLSGHLLFIGLATSAIAEGPPPVAPPETFTAEQRRHWAYQPVNRPELPAVKENGWVRNPIDRFILAGHESFELRHAPEADRISLIRRLTFDLTGLPPTPEEVDAFTRDSRPDAYERLVDRLLGSSAYGERWAQHWLDLAHYADSNGFELDAERPDAWRYRDWVVRALNDDMPYDRFLTLQLAGDEAQPGDAEALVATGFGRGGPREVVGGNVDPAVRRQSELTEVTGTVGSVFLGLTVGCARCHDHKFDAFPTTDYYRLQSFFAAAEMVDKPLAPPIEFAAHTAAKKAIDAKAAPFRTRMAEIEAPYRKTLLDAKKGMLSPTERAVMALPAKDRTPAQKRLAEGLSNTLRVTWEEVAEAVARNPADHSEREKLKRQIDAMEKTLPAPPASATALVDEKPVAPETFVYRRGDVKTLGPRVAPRPPGVLMSSQPAGAFQPSAFTPTKTTTGRRLALARWLARSDNPLTARVVVNRLWQHHYGRGIVATPSDFGVRGEEPSHPELLDWLASELVAGEWRLKPIHRLMVASAAYRQASTTAGKFAKTQASLDPDNTYLWRMNRRRVEAESLRDAMLAVTGELNRKAGGPGVLPPIEKEVADLIFTEAEVVELWPVTPDRSEHLRRSLYLFRKRNVRYPMFDAFDAPDTQSACPQRAVSTHALQALVLLNSDFATDRAKALAGRLYREAGSTDERIARAYKLVLGRSPRAGEADQARSFLYEQAGFLRVRSRGGQSLARPTFASPAADPAEAAAWVDFSLAMLNRNEFLYVP
jgi:Protein of unknown function (DUF1553)/Protein of unknown function (DUF1549)